MGIQRADGQLVSLDFHHVFVERPRRWTAENLPVD
jgi:hypothetical protein